MAPTSPAMQAYPLLQDWPNSAMNAREKSCSQLWQGGDGKSREDREARIEDKHCLLLNVYYSTSPPDPEG